VYSRTPSPSRRAMMRKPSCLISCSQSGPDGGRSAGNGRQGLIWPRGWVRRGNVRVRGVQKTCLKGDGRYGSIIPSPGTLTQQHNAKPGSSGRCKGLWPFRPFPLAPTNHPALRRLRSLRSRWGLRLRSPLRSLRNLASVDRASSGQVVSRDDVLRRFRGQRHRKSTN
jgi:hypothetical protein